MTLVAKKDVFDTGANGQLRRVITKGALYKVIDMTESEYIIYDDTNIHHYVTINGDFCKETFKAIVINEGKLGYIKCMEIKKTEEGAVLRIININDEVVFQKTYSTYFGASVALGKRVSKYFTFR